MWNYWHELFLNDAKYFAERMNEEFQGMPALGTEEIKPEDGRLKYRRFSAASILFAFTALEAIINEFAQEYVSNNEVLPKQKQEFLTGERKERFVSLGKKLQRWIPKICNGKNISRNLMNDFKEARNIRNALVHLNVSDDTKPIMGWPESRAVYCVLETVQGLILEIYRLYGKIPSDWIKNKKSIHTQ
ncbi:MAG: hypothetical protein K9L86_06710 [Candidatus Omnitrophica bacterium]|nr:hypothetical protein [Candidatus Omnitrophota bacterium]